MGDLEGWEAVVRIQSSFRSIELKWDRCSWLSVISSGHLELLGHRIIRFIE